MYGFKSRAQRMRDGGKVVGPGTGTSDSIKTEVPEGSYIMPADSTKALGFDMQKPQAAQQMQPRLGMKRDDVPVNLSNGEFELTPEQVHAVGVQALEQMKNATHTPAKGYGLNAEALKAYKSGPKKPELFFADGGLVEDPEKQPRFGFGPKAQGNNPTRAQQMQEQFNQPVTGPQGVVNVKQPQAAIDAPFQNTPAPQRPGAFGLRKNPLNHLQKTGRDALGAQPIAEQMAVDPANAPATAAGVPTASAAPVATQGDTPEAPRLGVRGWRGTGIGADRQGGEIATRTGADGVPEFTNEAATPGAVSGAVPEARYGMRRDQPAGSAASVGDGRGTFSQGEAGDAKMAMERFERANQIRSETQRPRELGDAGGRVTVVADSSRAPSIPELMRARQEGRQAQTEALRAQTQQETAAGNQRMATEQLQQQKLQQDLAMGRFGVQDRQRLAALQAKLADPSLSQEDRAAAQQSYLMQADPKTYMDNQAKAGIGQVDLEKKQLERDKLRLELEQSGSGDGIKLTEQQSKDLGYYTRGNEANAQLARQGDALTARATGERGQTRGIADTLVRGTPWIGDSALANSLVSTERQQAEQAGREVLAAILRKDTGAAITQQEMEIYGRMYLPQPGDSDEVLNQKAEARTRALASIRGGLGTAERKAAPLLDGQRTNSASPPRVNGDSDYDALPRGALFIAPDGSTRRKP